MPKRRLYVVVLAEEFADCLRLCRRLNDNEFFHTRPSIVEDRTIVNPPLEEVLYFTAHKQRTGDK